jgi:hypothetical protein
MVLLDISFLFFLADFNKLIQYRKFGYFENLIIQVT